MAVSMTQGRLASRLNPLQHQAARPAPPPTLIAAAGAAARPAAAAARPPTPTAHRRRQRRRLAGPCPPPAALPSFFNGGGGTTRNNQPSTTHPLWSYLGSAVDPLHPEQAALMHRLAFARRPSATHVVVVFSSRCAACRASEDEVERFASGLMHELRFAEGRGARGGGGGGGGGSNGRLRVSSLDVTPGRGEAYGANGNNSRAAEVAGRLLGVEELPTAVVFVEGAPGCIRVGPKWRPDKPALTAERLLRVVNAARARALGGDENAGESGGTNATTGAGPPLELVESAHWPLGRDLLGLPPLWGEESVAALGGLALEEELRRVAVGEGEEREEQEGKAAARPSEASAAATAKGPQQEQQRHQQSRPRQKQQQPQLPCPTQLAAIAPSASASYWSRPGKATFWLGVGLAATLLWAWDVAGMQRRFERWQLARRTAARARGVRYSREVDEMDATDVLMDAIERAGAARLRAGTTGGGGGGGGGGGKSGAGRGGGGGGQGAAAGKTPADVLAAAETDDKRDAAKASWSRDGADDAAAIDVLATDVQQQPQQRGAAGARTREPPPDASAR